MLLGIVSDTHNHLENTRQALDQLRARQVTRVIHCGDITTPAVVELFEGFQVTFVFGNMDHFHADLMEAAKRLFGMGSMGYSYTAAIDGRRVAVCHGDDIDILQNFIREGVYDFVLHGHTHLRRSEKVGGTWVINPGALGGRQAEERSFCVLDLATDEAEFIMIESAD